MYLCVFRYTIPFYMLKCPNKGLDSKEIVRFIARFEIKVNFHWWISYLRVGEIIECFCEVFRHFMHIYDIKSSPFTKLGDFQQNTEISKKLFGASGAKNVSLNPIFPKSSYFSAPSAPKNVSLNAKIGPPFWPLPPQWHTWVRSYPRP